MPTNPVSVLAEGVFPSPIVSIGVGNGNSPENTGPIFGNTYNGQVFVYATVSDTDLDNYHFRVIKDGGIDGYTCTGEGALFLPENQGYASTTLNKEACGFVFNQSVYVSPTGFTNSIIATLNTEDIIAYSGEGEYWLILGAIDTAGNRTNSNYLNDPKIKITVSSTTPVVQPAVTSGGGGGNGPIANSYGSVTSQYFPVGVSNPEIFAIPEPVNQSSYSKKNTINTKSSVVADGGIPQYESADIEGIDPVTSNQDVQSDTDQLAQVVSSGFTYNWIWLLILIAVVISSYYLIKKRN